MILVLLLAIPAAVLAFALASGVPARAVHRSASVVTPPSMVTLRGITRLSGDDDDDDDYDDGDDFGGFEDEADSLFNFDDSGNMKAGAVRPHLKLMMETIASGSATLLDVRSADEWRKANRADAKHCALKELLAQGDQPPVALAEMDPSSPLYVVSSFKRPEDAYAAADSLRDRGFTDVRTLDDSFEALQAQVPCRK